MKKNATNALNVERGCLEEPDSANSAGREWTWTGKRYDVGKSCARFKKLEDLPLPLIGESVALMEAEEFAERVEKARATPKGKGTQSR